MSAITHSSLTSALPLREVSSSQTLREFKEEYSEYPLTHKFVRLVGTVVVGGASAGSTIGAGLGSIVSTLLVAHSLSNGGVASFLPAEIKTFGSTLGIIGAAICYPTTYYSFQIFRNTIFAYFE